MSICNRTFMILWYSFVKSLIFFFCDFTLFSEPNSFNFINSFPFPNLFCNSFCLRIIISFTFFFSFSVTFTLILDFSIFLYFWFFTFGLFSLFSWFCLFGSLFILNLLSNFLRKEKSNWILDELWIFLDQILNLILFYILYSIIFQMKSDTCASSKSVSSRILGDEEFSVCSRSPNVLFIISALWGNHNFIGNQESWIKSNTKLSNKTQTLTFSHSFQESSCTTLSNGSQILNQLSLSHTNTSVSNRDGLGIIIKINFNFKIWISS